MIHLLAEYSRKQGLIAEPGFKPKRIKWAVCGDSKGRFTGLIPLGDVGAKNNPGQEFSRCPDLSQGELIGGSGSRRHFLADTAEVVLLVSKSADEPKLAAKHDFFAGLMRKASASIPALAPIAALLESGNEMQKIRAECERQKVKPNDRVTFRTDMVFPLDKDYWHEWWRGYREGLSVQHAASAQKRRCFVTGELTDGEKTHDKITGLLSVGGQPAGDVLIGFDKDAFCSFGFSQGQNASVSSVGAASYRSGLNDLLSNFNSSVTAGNARIAFWFKDHVEDSENPLWALLGGPSPQSEDLAARQRVIDFMASVHTGRIRSLEGNRYYALTLSGAGGRVMVRGWMEGSFESLASAVSTWFSDLQITSLTGDSLARPSPLDRLSYNCLSLRSQRSKQRKESDDERRRISQALFHAALNTGSLSDMLLARVLTCLRSELPSAGADEEDMPLQPNRFAIIRAYLVRFFRKKGSIDMSQAVAPTLNPRMPSAPAYHCGRILAILAALQKRALGSVGAGVIQRYYASASTNPGLVFGRLIKNSQYHIEKLGSDKSGYLESLLAQATLCVPGSFPQVLSLQEQGLFALGYYHQIAELRKKRIATGETETLQTEIPQEETQADATDD